MLEKSSEYPIIDSLVKRYRLFLSICAVTCTFHNRAKIGLCRIKQSLNGESFAECREDKVILPTGLNNVLETPTTNLVKEEQVVTGKKIFISYKILDFCRKRFENSSILGVHIAKNACSTKDCRCHCIT